MNIEQKVKELVANTFNLGVEEIAKDSGPENISEWDSFGQMNLVTLIEDEFGFQFDFEEIFRIYDTESLINLVEDKINGK